jgi:hypothetical protein
MSIINSKNVNNQSSLSVDTVNIGIINCNELDTNIINSNGGNLQYVAIGNSTITNSARLIGLVDRIKFQVLFRAL